MNLLRPDRQPRISLVDFEEMLLNRPEHEKWELIDGRVVKSMVGARWEHKQIVLNLTLGVNNHLRKLGKPCRGFDETFWIKDEPFDFGAFPDLMVFCGKLEPGQTSIDNPLILFEVLSPGTASHDRLAKRIAYQRLESLQSYVLIERDRIFVDAYRRRADGWHGDPPLERLDQSLALPEIEYSLMLAEIYRDVADTG
mgnify:CR=1 FL=1